MLSVFNRKDKRPSSENVGRTWKPNQRFQKIKNLLPRVLASGENRMVRIKKK